MEQREDLEDTLDEAGLTPVAILGSHTHIDHMAPTPTSKRPGGPRW